MPAAAVAVGGIASSLIGASAASSAASSQAGAYRDAAAISRAAAEKARKEILDRMVPALESYQQGIVDAQDTIRLGTADVMNILQNTTGTADQMLQSVGVDARRALLGSAATAQGIPRQQFDQQYDVTLQGALPALPAQQITPDGTPTQQISQTLAGISGTPELTRDAAGNLVPVSMARQGIQPTIGGVAGGTPAAQQAQAATQTAIQPGYYGASQTLQQGQQQGLQQLFQGAQTARSDIAQSTQAGLESIAQGRQGALGAYTPYTEAGQAAIQQEAALSGALGPEAQQAAINSFIESPGQKYLREQQEKALLRSSAATGGLGGGRVRSALMEQAMGIAATQQQQQLENLRSLASRGQEAAGATAGIYTGTGAQQAQLQTQAGQNLSQLANALGVNASQLINASSSELAQLAQATGINLAQLEQTIGTARTAGVQNLGSALAQTAAGQTSDIARLTEQGATTGLTSQQNISQILANLATQTGTQVAGLTASGGEALAAGQLAAGQQIASGVQGLGNVAAYQLAQGQNTYNPSLYTATSNPTLPGLPGIAVNMPQ